MKGNLASVAFERWKVVADQGDFCSKEVPDVCDLYILRACVAGTISLSSNTHGFIAQITELLRQGYDIESAREFLVSEGEKIPNYGWDKSGKMH